MAHSFKGLGLRFQVCPAKYFKSLPTPYAQTRTPETLENPLLVPDYEAMGQRDATRATGGAQDGCTVCGLGVFQGVGLGCLSFRSLLWGYRV